MQPGLRRGRPGLPAIGATASSSGSSWVMSLQSTVGSGSRSAAGLGPRREGGVCCPPYGDRLGSAPFFPPCTARTEELSTITRKRSNWSAPRSLDSKTKCSRSHTPASCHSRKRRRHVIPEPQPISWAASPRGCPTGAQTRYRSAHADRRAVCAPDTACAVA